MKKKKSRKIKYEFAPDLQTETETICEDLFPHIKLGFVRCFRSSGSSAKRTIARCYGLSKIMQKTIGCTPHYAIEFITEQFDTLSPAEKTKTIIHELMHIPKSFGGGFRYHNYVTYKNVTKMYEKYTQDINDKSVANQNAKNNPGRTRRH